MIQGQEVDILVYEWLDIDVVQIYVFKKEIMFIGWVMKIDLYIFNEQEFIGLAKVIMEWKWICYLFIEDDYGNLKGLVICINFEVVVGVDDYEVVSVIMIWEFIMVI